MLGSRIFPEISENTRPDVFSSQRSTWASEECSLRPNITINSDGSLTQTPGLGALSCRLCHRNALCLKTAFLFYSLLFPSPRFRLLIKLAVARGLPLPLGLGGVPGSLHQGVSERGMFNIRELCSGFVPMLRCIHAIVLLFLFAERIIDTILTATKTYGLSPELDR